MGKSVKRKKKVREAPKVKSYHGRVRNFHIPAGLQTPTQIREELAEYRDVLAGRADPPMQKGVMTMMEVAEAYFSRACEIEQMILRGKAEGWLPTGKGYETLRTQEIRSFKEQAKSSAELGSRRITFENLRWQQENRGLESLG